MDSTKQQTQQLQKDQKTGLVHLILRLLAQNLAFQRSFKVEALLGVTLDKNNVVIISVNHVYQLLLTKPTKTTKPLEVVKETVEMGIFTHLADILQFENSIQVEGLLGITLDETIAMLIPLQKEGNVTGKSRKGRLRVSSKTPQKKSIKEDNKANVNSSQQLSVDTPTVNSQDEETSSTSKPEVSFWNSEASTVNKVTDSVGNTSGGHCPFKENAHTGNFNTDPIGPRHDGSSVMGYGLQEQDNGDHSDEDNEEACFNQVQEPVTSEKDPAVSSGINEGMPTPLQRLGLKKVDDPWAMSMINVRDFHKPVREKKKKEMDRPFKCYVCDKAYVHQQSLKCHMKLHEGYNLYTCQECGKKICPKRSP